MDSTAQVISVLGEVSAPDRPQIGISACLLGDEVRYNGGHKRSGLCLESMGAIFAYQKFCPEMAAGFGTPRPTLRLRGEPEAPELVFNPGQKNVDVEQNHAPALKAASQPAVEKAAHLDGYILMQKSPSCGLDRVKVYQPSSAKSGGEQWQVGRGIFAEALLKRYPMLPIEEEGRLHDPGLCESFVSRVYAYRRFREMVWDTGDFNGLLAFHRRYKYLLMAHSVPAYKQLGQLIAAKRKDDLQQQFTEYQEGFMAALSKVATRKGHANALMHVLGYLKEALPGEARQDLANTIHRYREGEIYLSTPMALLQHYFQRYPEAHGSDYILEQFYLSPYPESLGLRNHI